MPTERLHPIAACPAFAERYELAEPLGQGGFARVFRAVQRSTGQSVAVKVLEDPSEPETRLARVHVERFRREMKLCAGLHHPHLVRLIDAGDAEGWLYTVFEFVPGRSLSKVLEEEGPLPPEEALHLMGQVLDAIGWAHRQGVIHRDLTPANIMVSEGLRRNGLVLDFGIGAFSERLRTQETARLTATHEAIGTPSYAAPEQLRGESPTVRTDLYSWGLVLLECLTGEKPVRGESLQEQLAQQLGPDPVAVPEAIRGLPVYRVLSRALAKRPEERAASAEELMELLRTASSPLSSRLASARADGDASVPLRPVTVLSVRGTWTQPARNAYAAQRRILALQASVDEAVRAHGGQTVAALGSRVVALFGYGKPIEQAARAGLEAAAAVRRAAGTGGAEDPALFLAVRSGGLPAPEDEAPLPFEAAASAVVDEAIALEARAEPGEIRACEETRRRLRDPASLEPVPGRAPGEPPCFRLVETGIALRGAISTSATLIGRREELARLEGAARRALKGRPQSMLVVGEAGIGKSRLIHELRRRLHALDWIVLGCTPESAHSPLRPVVEWLATWTREVPLETRLRESGLDVGALHPLFAELMGWPFHPDHPPQPLGLRRKRERVMDAILDLLFAEARRRPLILWIEDLHWADPTTRELLLELVRRIRSADVFDADLELPLLGLFTARASFDPPWSLSDVTVVQLPRLSREDSAELARMVLRGAARADERLIESVVHRAGGVPLFLEEMARASQESSRRSGLEPAPAMPALPATLHDLLDARIAGLRANVRRTAQQAACVGREFDFALLSAVDGRDEELLREDLAELRRDGILYRRSASGADRYAFHHVLLSDAARESMRADEHRYTHLEIARCLLEDSSQQVAAQHPERLAHHFEEGGALEPAVEFRSRAAFAAVARSAHLEAIHHWERALEMLLALPETPERDHSERSIRIAIGSAYMVTQGYAAEPVERSFERALELCNRYAEAPRLFSALNGLWAYHMNRGDVEQTATLVARMQELAESSGSERRLLFARHALGTTSFWAGRLTEALPALVEATALLDTASRETAPGLAWYRHAATAPIYLGWCLHLMGRPDEGLAWKARALALAETLRDVDARVEALTYAVALHHDRGEPDVALELSDVVVPLAEETGLDFWLGVAKSARGWARCQTGDLEAGLEEIDAGMAIFHRSGAMVPLVYRACYIAEAHLLTGRIEDGIATLDEALDRSGDRLDRFYDAEAHRLRGELLAHDGRAPAAEPELLRALAIARRQGARLFELRAAASLARLHQGTARARETRGILETAYRSFREGFDLPDLLQARALLEEDPPPPPGR